MIIMHGVVILYILSTVLLSLEKEELPGLYNRFVVCAQTCISVALTLVNSCST